MTVAVLRARDRRPSPWRNGGGITREVVSRPSSGGPDGFHWRVSLAELRAPGPFSAFPDVDRVLVLVDGSATLTVDGARHELRQHEPFEFSGAAATACELPAGAATALNVMTRRGGFRADVDVLHVSGTRPVAAAGAGARVLLVLAGALAAEASDGSSSDLGPLDALSWTDPAPPLSLRGAGTAAVVRCYPGP